MLNAQKVALSLGSTVALIHVVWSLIVALGWGQGLADFAYTMHFMSPIALVGEFNFGTAIGLVIVSGIIGGAVGYVFATVWNFFHKR